MELVKVLIVPHNSEVITELILLCNNKRFRRISTFNACKELPFDLENAILLWLNKVNYVNNCNFGRIQEQKPTNSEPIRARKDQLVEKNVFPRVLSLQEALHDGKTLLSIILYYSSNTIKIEGVVLCNYFSGKVPVLHIHQKL